MQDIPLFAGADKKFSQFIKDRVEFDYLKDTRIPSILTITNGKYAGNVIAVADKASSGADWGRIEACVRVSTDNGETFDAAKTVISPPVRKYTYNGDEYSSAFIIDPVLVENKNGKVILLVGFFPECKGLHKPGLLENSTGYVLQEGKSRLLLHSSKSALDKRSSEKDKQFTLHEDGFIYTLDGEKTKYYIPKRHNPAYAYSTMGDMYYARGDGQYVMKYPPLIPEYSDKGDIYVGNIYLSTNKPEFSFDNPQFVQKWEVFDSESGNLLCAETSAAPLRCEVTSYIWKSESTDGGKNFSKPVDITPEVKLKKDGAFFGTAPGNGIMLSSLLGNGRLLVPVYALGKAAVIISDDDGKTWRRGNQIYCKNIDECQLVESADGSVFCFGRPLSAGKVPMSVSRDCGDSFTKLKDSSLYTPKCQKAVVRLPQELSLPDCLENDGNYVVISTPTGHNGCDRTRTDGKVYLGHLLHNSIEFIKTYHIKDLGKYSCFENYADFFAYSSLCVLKDGAIGVLYEAYPSGYIVFSKFKL